MKDHVPGLNLLLEVKAGFVRQNTCMTRWARENNTHVSNVRNALLGSWDGPRGRAMRKRVIKAARIEASA
ncbi:hypothetical protein [Rhodanobacter lindaniclasticus]